MIGFQNWGGGGGGGGGGCASFAPQPLLDSQVIRIFRLKNHFIIVRAVTYVIRERMCFQAAMSHFGNYWLVIFSEMATGYERMCLCNKSYRPSL